VYIEGAMHRFVTGRSDPALAEDIKDLCEKLGTSFGYSPRLDAVPFHRARELSVDQQKAALRLHPEKVALAELLRCKSEDLEVSINFKVCSDCHDFMKAMARYLRRPVTLRESRVVHIFSDEGCSCADGWSAMEVRHCPQVMKAALAPTAGQRWRCDIARK